MTTTPPQGAAARRPEEAPADQRVREAHAFSAVTPDEFKAAFRHHPGGVAVVTATGRSGHVALTATSVSSVSADPPLLVFSISDTSSSAPTIAEAESMVVHLIEAGSIELARLGATSGIDRFEDEDLWTTLVTGEPVFHGTSWIRVEPINRLHTGTATIIVAQALQSNISVVAPAPDRVGLVYVNRAWHRIDDSTRIEP